MEPPSRTSRTSHGCWTCRLRRKKCDEQRPVCDTCAALCITCHYGDKKPEWMDGGTRQEKMIEQLKREVKQNAPYRRFERPHVSGDKVFNTGSGERLAGPQNMMPEPKQNGRDRSKESHVSPSQGTSCFHLDRSSVVGRSDSILTTFYLQIRLLGKLHYVKAASSSALHRGRIAARSYVILYSRKSERPFRVWK
ncbi:hypothetical protein V2G26_018742 [Clonostachys chloroleuca]